MSPEEPIDAGFKEGTEPSVPQVATLQKIRELAAQRKAKPPSQYTSVENGLVYTFRAINGAELEKVQSWAAGDEGKFQQLLVNEASIDPKVDLAFWAELNQLGPLATTELVLFVNEISGMGEEAVKKAKNASKGVVA